MATFEGSIDVNVPVRTAYDQWTPFETFPMFMEGVDEVRQVTDTKLPWRAEIAGRTESREAEVTEQRSASSGAESRATWSVSRSLSSPAARRRALGGAR